jgi:hypothetical protein
VTCVVIDPGHGGDSVAGGSTPFGARGRIACEKDVALDVARCVRDRAPGAIRLTRDADRNLPLAERIWIARELGAVAFVSIHAGGADAGPEAWIHTRASLASRRFGARVAWALASAAASVASTRVLGIAPSPALFQGPLAILDADRHAPDSHRASSSSAAWAIRSTRPGCSTRSTALGSPRPSPTPFSSSATPPCAPPSTRATGTSSTSGTRSRWCSSSPA